MKAQEVATVVADQIRDAVKQEVETQVGALKSTMLNLIDRVIDLESNSPDRQKREEAPSIPQDDEVVQGPHAAFTDSDSPQPG
jgi:hypothetical protein